MSVTKPVVSNKGGPHSFKTIEKPLRTNIKCEWFQTKVVNTWGSFPKEAALLEMVKPSRNLGKSGATESSGVDALDM